MPTPLTYSNQQQPYSTTKHSPNMQPIDHSQSTTQRQTQSDSNSQYNDYIRQRKKLQKQQTPKQTNNQKIYVIIVSIFFGIMLVTAVVYSIKFKSNTKIYAILNKENTQQQQAQPPNHFYTRHEHHATVPSAATANPPQTDNCDSLLPYDILAETKQDFQQVYYSWYGKVGSNIYGRNYDVGHFIERHVAVNKKCTQYQKSQQKTVFYDWNQALKAYKQTLSNSCPVGDRTTFSYDFQTKIASPTDYIKGIDCRSGTVRKYSKVFALYRRAVEKRNPSNSEYLDSDYVTLWTFYPKI